MNYTNFTIETLNKSHIPNVVALHFDFKKSYEQRFEAFYYKTDEFVNTTLTNFLNTNILNDNFLCYVAKNMEGDIVGYIFGFINTRAPIYQTKQYGFLSNLYVNQNNRHKGIAQALYNKLELWFKLKNMPYVEVNRHQADTYVADFYNKLGFASITTNMFKLLN